MKTILRKSVKGSSRVYGLKAVDGMPGVYEAIVAVFGNVDYGNDRILGGAFAKSLTRWKDSGDPIPVIFSHQWDDLEAHVGLVLDAKELLAGDPELPAELKLNGGLWTRFKLDVDDPDERTARLLAKRLDDRRIKEFSFAYDVLEEKTGTDGVNNLIELDLIEVGPTLKGMNPATVLLARARKALADGDELSDMTDEDLAELMVKTISHAFAPGEDPTRCILCGLTRNTVAHYNSAGREADSKAWITLTGSMEETQEEVYEEAVEWASSNNIGEGGFYCAYLEATFDDHVVILVEGWDDPPGDGDYYTLDYEIDETGEATVSNPQAVELEATAITKSRAMKHRKRPGSAPKAKGSRTVPGGKSESQGQKTEELEDEDQHETGLDPVLVELELAELELPPPS